MTEENGYFLVVLGDEADFAAGRGSHYYFEHNNGNKILLVFTTRERAEDFVRLLQTPEAHVDMLESVRPTHIEPLIAGRFSLSFLEYEGVAELAIASGMDLLQRDPGPGRPMEVMRV